MSLAEWNLTIGEIVAPFSRFGEVKVRLDTDFPERFSRLKQVCVRPKNGDAHLRDVETCRFHKGQVLLKLKGIESINDAEMFRNAAVQVRDDEAIVLPENEFYIHDLIGCKVVTADGRELGSVTSVLSGPANDVYVVGSGKEEILLPAIKDVIQNVDIAARRITVTLTPGLLPDEAEEV